MLLTDLFEEQEPSQNLLVVYPGRFQPWHKGHQSVFNYLQRKFGRDAVWIATSNKVELPKSPFSFSDKTQFMMQTGVHVDRIVETRNPYQVPELVERYNPDSTILIFAVSEKDMAEDPRFKMGTKKDGTPSYFQPLPKDLKECAPLAQHGYIMTVPTVSFTVLGQPMESATEIRKQYIAADEKTRKEIIKDLFGSYSREIEQIFDAKLGAPVKEDAAGVGVIAKNKRMAADPRYSMSITQDVKPGTMDKNMRALRLKEDEPGKVLIRFKEDYNKFVPASAKEKIAALLKLPSVEYIPRFDAQALAYNPKSLPFPEGRAYYIPHHIFERLQDTDDPNNKYIRLYIEMLTTTNLYNSAQYNEDITDFSGDDPMNPRVAPRGGVGTMPLRDWKKMLQKRVAELNKELSIAMGPGLIDKKHIWDNISSLLDPSSPISNIARAIVDAHKELELRRRRGGAPSRGIARDE